MAEIAKTAVTTPVPVEIDAIDVSSDPAETRFRTVGYLDETTPAISDAQSTVPKLRSETRYTNENPSPIPNLNMNVITTKIPAVATTDECAKTLADVANIESEPIRSESSIAKIAMSLTAGDDFCLKFETSLSPSTQSRIPPRDIATMSTKSVPQSTTNASEACLAAEYDEDFAAIRKRITTNIGDRNPESTLAVSAYIAE